MFSFTCVLSSLDSVANFTDTSFFTVITIGKTILFIRAFFEFFYVPWLTSFSISLSTLSWNEIAKRCPSSNGLSCCCPRALWYSWHLLWWLEPAEWLALASDPAQLLTVCTPDHLDVRLCRPPFFSMSPSSSPWTSTGYFRNRGTGRHSTPKLIIWYQFSPAFSAVRW